MKRHDAVYQNPGTDLREVSSVNLIILAVFVALVLVVLLVLRSLPPSS